MNKSKRHNIYLLYCLIYAYMKEVIKMQERILKKGISLVVLVITIIVMIILAGAVILSLNNSGIISKAQEAVNQTNLKQLQEMASVAWASAYTDPEVDNSSAAALETAVITYLTNAGYTAEDLDNYTITVTTSGVTVTSVATATE